ncbi:MAG: VTC domain-containing protein, partial [Prevotella sp.]|nr:VTC domain-containing protein [Prevotella sp.]
LIIDLDVAFHNLETDRRLTLSNVAVIELKRDGRVPSPVLALLRQLRIKPMGFSKYCIGMALTDPALPRNRIKERLRNINKLENNN